ncbi:MAG TPA: hypothetical protein HPQ04_05315 [Rhodospirillaceae bacterium]|nr:hypothetical protein [Rhodospirillaceae bacterium]
MLGRLLRALLMVMLAVSIAGQPAYAGKKKAKAKAPPAAHGEAKGGEAKGGEGKEAPPANPNVTVANIPSMSRPEAARGPVTMLQTKAIFPVRPIEKMRIPSIFE